MQIVFVGGGNMATALIGGMLRQGFAADEISVMEPDAAKRDQLQQEFGVKTLASVPSGSRFDVVLLAVKPQQMKAVAQEWAGVAAQALVISIAAGISLSSLRSYLGPKAALVRCMPGPQTVVHEEGLVGGHRAQVGDVAQGLVGQVGAEVITLLPAAWRIDVVAVMHQRG